MSATAAPSTRFPFARGDLPESVDTVHLVQRIPKRPHASDLRERGFSSKPGKHPNSTTWFHNAPTSKHLPNLTIYENYGPGFGFVASVSVPKYCRGQNFDLLDTPLIFDSLQGISDYATDLSGISYDAFAAFLARIDFATNLNLKPDHADIFLKRCRRLYIARMPIRADLTQARSVYHGSMSRMIRSYDKTYEMGIEDPLETRIRLEYSLPDKPATKRFADRIRAKNHRAETLLSPEVRGTAIGEMLGLLRLSSFDPGADYSLGYFLTRTGGDLNRARRCSSFVESIETLGPGYYEIPGTNMSRTRYLRELRDCQVLGY